ncbi:peptide chain release factor 2 [Candidatus Saccharibacteria bacterium]|nr:peptide chain release factor 2 [Candidatus Saccharibacteria bacterium]
MDNLKKRVDALQNEVKKTAEKISLDQLEVEQKNLLAQMQKSDFWQDAQKAQEISKREAALNSRVAPWKELQKEVDDLLELVNIGDTKITEELEEQLSTLNSQLSALMRDLRFSGPFDDHDVILSIYAGAGGTDAQDWAQMLLRMYLRWAESHPSTSLRAGKLKVEVLEQSSGEEAGIKSATVKISGGDFLYGKLAGEHGVHRLVRLSPFNADHLRQTSFAKVEVMPAIDKPSEVQLDEKDLKIDVFRAGGHGGQSINTTDSAVRVTHIPTGITTSIQNERSQLQNKETALGILRSKLIQLQLEQHAENLSQLKGPSQSAQWGNQIRSYVLHPYKQVKDNRTGFESTEPDKILDGNLDPLIDACLEKL